MKKLRILTLLLLFSGALNIGLIATLVFSSLEEKSFSIAPFEEKKENSSSLLGAFSTLSFRELLSYLTNRDPLTEGYTKRDLALAALVAFHHFNLEKALSGNLLQRQSLPFSIEKQIEVFPGLSEEQFQAVVKFAYEEKWPLTAEGLFPLLKQSAKSRDETLAQAFCATPEFYALQLLFPKQDPHLLLDLVCEGNWDLFHQFSHEQEQGGDLSFERRQRFLSSYLALQSPTAASLLASETRAPPAPALSRYHVVAKGESLWKIANRYDIKVHELVKANDLEGDRLVPGMTLKIPSHGTGSEPLR